MQLADWYTTFGRHELIWRRETSRNLKWKLLVSEVMLQQTPVARIEKVFPTFIKQFPNPKKMASAGLGEVLKAWDRLGYPRRARNLFYTSETIAAHGWPDEHDYETLPGVGTYTASALRALTTPSGPIEEKHFAQDVNITRVCRRVYGSLLASREELFAVYKKITKTMSPHDALLGVMDLGAMVCTKTSPDCSSCPVKRVCATKGVLPGEPTSRQKPYIGSMRQKRGDILRHLRGGIRSSSQSRRRGIDVSRCRSPHSSHKNASVPSSLDIRANIETA